MSAIWPFSMSVLVSVSGISKTSAACHRRAAAAKVDASQLYSCGSIVMSGFFASNCVDALVQRVDGRLLGAGQEAGDRDGDLVAVGGLVARRVVVGAARGQQAEREHTGHGERGGA